MITTYGYDHHLLHDAHHRCTPIEAAQLGKSLEPYKLFWLEDAVPAELHQTVSSTHHHANCCGRSVFLNS
ncbi:enolase C-terminal domain-like protein [Aliiglaciecola sp. LCG003]|uniref:enolase C-terminal domain-like protein n=1 Tax=Aliiglaciecola sp. LCG003 TaxID=3053655 RepID=UPI0033654D6C